MLYDFSSFRKGLAEVKDWLSKEYSGLRTGRATPLLLDGILVESYGSRVPLKQVGSISTEDARTLRVAPWDKGQIKAIETAIAAANLGVSTSPDGEGVRVIFPELTGERRRSLAKIVKEKMEDARVSLRQERERVWEDIQRQERDKKISEDDKFRYKDELQKLVDDSNKMLTDLAAKKAKEILS